MNNTKIAVIGGTGDLGGGLVYRWAKAGLPVIIGSRKEEKAVEAKQELLQRLPEANVSAMDNVSAARAADIVVMSVPFGHQQSTLESIKEAVQGKIFIDTTVCLAPPKVGTVQIPAEGCAGVIAQNILGEDVKVVSAFQDIAAAHLNSDHSIECDVLVCGNDKESRTTTIELAEIAGMKAWHAGPIANAVAAEALTSILITLNRQYKIPGAGIVITGTPGTA